MKVLLTSPVFPPDLGGPAVYVPSFGRFLVERGHDVRVVAFCSDPEPKGHPFEVRAISRGPLPVRYLKAFFAVWKAARDVDVVYVNEHLALLHVLAARLAGKPAMIRIMVDGAWEIAHRKGWCGDDDIVEFQKHSYGFKVKLTRFLQRRWWKWCTHIIACSEFLRQILIRSHGVAPDKVQRIFNAYHGPTAADVTVTCEQARAAEDAAQIAAMGASSAMIAFEPDGTIITANEIFCAAMNCTDSWPRSRPWLRASSQALTAIWIARAWSSPKGTVSASSLAHRSPAR